MLSRPTPAGKAVAWLALPIALVAYLPLASWAYAELCHYQYTPWVWFAGLQYGYQPDNVLLAGGAGALGSVAIAVFLFWLAFPPKPLHGAARLARTGEIRKAKLYRASPFSILLGRHNGRLIAFSGDLHPFLAAATGTGKGVGFVVPNLLHWQGSTVVLDIKGENYTLTSGYRSQVLKQKIFRFDPLNPHGRTHCFNVLAYVRGGDLRVSDVQTIAAILVANESSDPYWDNSARDLLMGLLLLVLEAGPEMGWPVTIGQVHRMVRTEEETGAYLEGLIGTLDERGIVLSDLCRRYILSFCNEPEKPRGSIKSSLATKLTLWANPLVERATQRSDFDLGTFRRQPTSLYLAIAPDELQRLTQLIRLVIEFFLALNTRSGETPADDPTLKVPVLVLLDEFLSLGKMEKIVHALSYVRGWGIRIATVIQSEAQLQAVYGRELAEFFVDNHRARVYYRPPIHRRDLAEHLAKVVGQKTVRQRSYSYGGPGPRSTQVSQTGQAILDPDEIAHLREDETIVMVDGLRPLIGRKLRYYKDRTFKERRLKPVDLPAVTDPLQRSEARKKGLAHPASIAEALEAIPVPEADATDAELQSMAEAFAEIVSRADPDALAAVLAA